MNGPLHSRLKFRNKQAGLDVQLKAGSHFENDEQAEPSKENWSAPVYIQRGVLQKNFRLLDDLFFIGVLEHYSTLCISQSPQNQFCGEVIEAPNSSSIPTTDQVWTMNIFVLEQTNVREEALQSCLKHVHGFLTRIFLSKLPSRLLESWQRRTWSVLAAAGFT